MSSSLLRSWGCPNLYHDRQSRPESRHSSNFTASSTCLVLSILAHEWSTTEHLLYNFASGLYKTLCNKVECGMVVQHVSGLEWLKHSHSRDGDGLRQNIQLVQAKQLPHAFGVHVNALNRLRLDVSPMATTTFGLAPWCHFKGAPSNVAQAWYSGLC